MKLRSVLFIGAAVAAVFILAAALRQGPPVQTLETAGRHVPTPELFAQLAGAEPVQAVHPAGAVDPVERGRYLVTIGGCNDCHTPWVMGPEGPQPDLTRMLSGHPADLEMPAAPASLGPWMWSGAATNTAFAGPWGVSFAANLTPDENTGTGIWTEEIFIDTIRSGRHWGQSRPLLPPMPWFNYREMSDEDLKAVFSYLQSLPPVYNPVPQPVPPQPAALADGALGG
jgi:mono/diheme cytochrome c family protein